MSLYAQVIVDVPTMQTNKPYTYLVPSELEEQIQAGCAALFLSEKDRERYKDSCLTSQIKSRMRILKSKK